MFIAPLALCGVVMLCVSSATVAIDGFCWNIMTKKLPIYPDATVAVQRYSFIQPFGVGDTIIVLETEDSPPDVRTWYGQTVSVNERDAQTRQNPFYHMARGFWSVTTAEDGTGSQITLSGSCAN